MTATCQSLCKYCWFFFPFIPVPVELRQSPSNTTVNETDRVVFICESFGLPQPTFVWSTLTNSDLSMRAQSDPSLSITSSSNQAEPRGGFTVQSMLVFESIIDSDAGQYTCTAYNQPTETLNSSDTASFYVVVQSE